MPSPSLSQSVASAPLFRRVAAMVPPYAALFLIIMALLINSPALFYMATAMVCTILACRLQAYLSVRGLRIERVTPPAARVGERVTVSITVWSEKRIKRPLISIRDGLPDRLVVAERTPSLPVAPSFDQPIQTRYSFRPLRRGIFRWSTMQIVGTDALGIVTMTRDYRTEATELVVYPPRIAVSVNLQPSGGAGGVSEAESGRFRGSGIEPRGVREYQAGDPLRHVHWASSARSRTLMVKEFEVGSSLAAAFFLQRTQGTDFGTGFSSLEAMCGHTVYLAEVFLKTGATVRIPTVESVPASAANYEDRLQQINHALALLEPTSEDSLAADVIQSLSRVGEGGSLFVMLAAQDPELPDTLARLSQFDRVCLIYDAADYDPKAAARSAADPVYLERLRQAGCRIVAMPVVEEFR